VDPIGSVFNRDSGLAVGLQEPEIGVLTPGITQNIEVLVIGPNLEIAVSGAVPLVFHFENFIAAIAKKEREWPLIHFVPGITFHSHFHE
jgi:hypothetical protein